jgi:hypothetical protein
MYQTKEYLRAYCLDILFHVIKSILIQKDFDSIVIPSSLACKLTLRATMALVGLPSRGAERAPIQSNKITR